MSFIMTDELCEIKANCIKTRKLLSIAEPVYEIHFPFFPVLPAVLLLENVKQSIELFLNQEKDKPDTYLLSGVKKMKIYRSVFPGDIIITEAKLIREETDKYIFDATIYKDSIVVAKIKEVGVIQEKEGEFV